MPGARKSKVDRGGGGAPRRTSRERRKEGPAGPSIRGFTLADYEAVHALWRGAGDAIVLGRSDTREEVAKKLRRDPDLFLVAEAEDRIVGTVIGGFDGRRGILYHLAVAMSHRRRGIARKLMAEVERRLRAKGCVRCYLLVKEGDADLLEFYHRLGYNPFGSVTLSKTIA